jgi:AcrR family transcriptional regulator
MGPVRCGGVIGHSASLAAVPSAPEVVNADRPKTSSVRRATGLPPEQRRATIAAAALQLLLERGTNITTRQIAEAANIAEGTTFRVFADKDAVIRAAVDLALDPAPITRALAEIDRDLPFEDQLVVAVEIIQRRMVDIGRLVSAVGGPAVFAGRERPLPDMAELASLFAPERRGLRVDPDRAARLLPALTLAFSHPALYGDQPMSPREIVSVLLDGIRSRPDGAGCDGRPSPC